MKILLLNGSPKGEKSDTLHMTRAFLDGMSCTSENEIEYLDVAKKHINYCKGCFFCKRNGGTCVYDDDMADILNQMLQSDLLLFSFPLYCFGIPAPLKALLDRTMPLSTLAMQKTGDHYEHIGQADFSHLRYVMISGCGFPNARRNFEALRLEFEMMFPYNLFMLTVPESPMFSAPEAAPVTQPFLALVKEAGQQYAQMGTVSAELMRKLSVPMIPEDVYAEICNKGQ